MESDSSVLGLPWRVVAFVGFAIAVVAWFILAPYLGAVSDWHAILIVSVGVLPGTLLLVYIALPLSRLRWSMLVLVAVALALVALACSQGSGTGLALTGNFAKLWAAVFAGWAFLYLFADVGLVVLIALLIPIVDAVSVFTPGAPTHEIVKHHIAIYNNVAVAFVGPHDALRPARPAGHSLLRAVPRRDPALPAAAGLDMARDDRALRGVVPHCDRDARGRAPGVAVPLGRLPRGER